MPNEYITYEQVQSGAEELRKCANVMEEIFNNVSGQMRNMTTTETFQGVASNELSAEFQQFKGGFSDYVNKVREYAGNEKAEVIPLCIKIEEELSGLEEQDKAEMLEALGLDESGLDKVVKTSYDLLGLMSFLTAGEPEVRAWTIKKGTKAPAAAGKIHSDIERGFIRAEIVSYEDLIREGSMLAAREKGLVRSEGKEYIMQDGDIVLFRFNV